MSAARPGDIAYLTGAWRGTEASAGARPAAIGVKFDPNGAPLADPGNTVICHLDPDSAAFDALQAIQAALMAAPFAAQFTYLPPASFHMTVFEGVIDHQRSAERWPTALPLDAPIDRVTAHFDQALRDISLPRRYKLRAEGIYAGIGLRLTGSSPDEEAALRRTRDRLAAATGLRPPDHDSYVFHITLAYLLRWMEVEAAQAVQALCATLFARHADSLHDITLGPPELCRFQTMHRFERLRYL
ncbi:MAG: DUF1868 domain-containing protein [Pseudomonadota bacterium]